MHRRKSIKKSREIIISCKIESVRTRRINMVDRRRGTKSPSPSPSFLPPISPPDGRVSTTIRRGHVPLNSSGQFFAMGGWGGLRGRVTIFEYVRARDPDVEWTRGLGFACAGMDRALFIHPLSSILSLRPLSRFHDRRATIRRGTRREATSHGVILAVCHVCTTMRVPTVEWPVYNPTMARLGPRAFAFCHSSLLGGKGRSWRREGTWMTIVPEKKGREGGEC